MQHLTVPVLKDIRDSYLSRGNGWNYIYILNESTTGGEREEVDGEGEATGVIDRTKRSERSWEPMRGDIWEPMGVKGGRQRSPSTNGMSSLRS